MTTRRFPPTWTVIRLRGGFKVVDANVQSLAYFYAGDNDNDAGTAAVLTMYEARSSKQLRQDAGAAQQPGLDFGQGALHYPLARPRAQSRIRTGAGL